MKTYEESILILADLKQDSSSFRYVCTGAYELLARMFNSTTVYEDVQEILDYREAQLKIERKQRSRDENEARRIANLAKKVLKQGSHDD